MVYDDSFWVTKLQLMGVWDEVEARTRFEAAMRRKREGVERRRREEEREFKERRGENTTTTTTTTATLFDVVEETERRRREEVEKAARELEVRKQHKEEEERRIQQQQQGEVDLLSAPMDPAAMAAVRIGQTVIPVMLPPSQMLGVLKNVRSIRGFARQEFARVYAILGPLYHDLVRARTHSDPEIFRLFRDPGEQAAMLAQLKTFSECDTAVGWYERTENLRAIMDVFENAALRELEGGYEAGDVDGRMKRYAAVLITLNGGAAGVQLFVQKHPVMEEMREELGNPLDCFDKPVMGQLSLEPAKAFFHRLAGIMKEQAAVIDRVFPDTVNVLLPFLERVAEDVIGEYISPVVDEAHDRDIEMYLKAVTGLFRLCVEFAASLPPTKGSGDRETFRKDVLAVMARVFDPHIDLYLQEELDYFRKTSESEVEKWEKQISEQDAATESFLMSNINREADKKDFLTTFRKVILAPVSVIPSAFSTSKAAPTTPKPEENPYSGELDMTQTNTLQDLDTAYHGHRISTLSITDDVSRAQSPAPPPTTELAAKAALMNSRLESIRSLFSIEVALNLVHKAKESLERAAQFTQLGGQTGEEAREQCETIFIALLQILGPRHVKTGFDKAVSHLSSYDPRSLSTHNPTTGVAPLITFLDLVNVGDLIQQMVDVFYEQELVSPHLTDRHDFLNPASAEKKLFEKMLDEKVAAGLNTGITVLISEVEHILATTQQPGDYNPSSPPATPAVTHTAEQVISCITSHTSLLAGSIDKTVLDVFHQEIGLRLFTSICKHIKRQRISVDGAITLICDFNHYAEFVDRMRINTLRPYYRALKGLAQIYLIDSKHAKMMASVIADAQRWEGVWRVEEVYEFAGRRADWYVVRKEVERAMYGFGCGVM
ncbi:hypothetical protein EX30DRAFT_324366 [Ascodesmis nigricans]|uniref:Exocyst complex component Sec10-like alpha-helical bundle domain-containing protein n=1 Tax=Ascodesmis nigricans TaxID=341454 RepID=A0A4S2MIY8_9PEZI|nr:hypothetical protein EX30DRAFT_324366 [Ascodesmis nigricans]